VHTNLVIQINQHNNHDNSVYIVNLYAVSTTDSLVIMFIFLTCSLALCWGSVSNSKITMTLAQLHYFYHKILGGTKDIMSPLFKSWGGHVPPRPPINSVPVQKCHIPTNT